MKEQGILFSAPMVRAILDGKKFQTRRLVKLNAFGPSDTRGYDWIFRDRGQLWQDYRHDDFLQRCARYGPVGRRLWVRETWAQPWQSGKGHPVVYRATYEGTEGAWRPSIHMPRWASRITLEVTDVRVQRLQEINEADALAEGIRSFTKDGELLKYWPCDPCDGPLKCAWADLPRDPVVAFRALWESLHGAGSWDANSWLWCYSFRRVEATE